MTRDEMAGWYEGLTARGDEALLTYLVTLWVMGPGEVWWEQESAR